MAGETDIPDDNLKGTPGQIKVEAGEISGDGADYRDESVDIRGGITTRVHKDGLSYVNRGVVLYGGDFTLSDFTTDGTWRTLDLSSIVSSTAKAVHLLLWIQDDAAESTIYLRKKQPKGTAVTNDANYFITQTQVANVAIGFDVIVPIGTDGLIEYLADALTWTAISINIRGWWQ